ITEGPATSGLGWLVSKTARAEKCRTTPKASPSPLVSELGIEQQPSVVLRNIEFLHIGDIAAGGVRGGLHHQLRLRSDRKFAPDALVGQLDRLRDPRDRHANLLQQYGLKVGGLDRVARQPDQGPCDRAGGEEPADDFKFVVDRN